MPECAQGHIDLSKERSPRSATRSTASSGLLQYGREPAAAGPLTFRVKEGASQFWFAVRIDNTGNALRSVQAKTAGGSFVTLKKYDYNYWQADSGLGPGPFTIRPRTPRATPPPWTA